MLRLLKRGAAIRENNEINIKVKRGDAYKRKVKFYLVLKLVQLTDSIEGVQPIWLKIWL